MSAQIEARIEQEKLERELTTKRAAQNEELRQGKRVTFIGPSFTDTVRPYFGFLALVLLVIGAGFFMASGSRFFGNKSGALPVQPSGNTASIGVAVAPPVPMKQATVDQADLAIRQQQRAQAEIRRMVMQWVEAWSRRDAAAYLSFYAADFNLPEGMQRVDWEAQRQSRLRKYRSIEVTLKNLKISYPGGDTANVRFTQDFQADSYTENGTQKELRLKNIQGSWFIVSEKNSPD